MDTFNIFISFQKELDKIIENENELTQFIQSMKYLIDRADCEKGIILYHYEQESNHFAQEIEDLGYAMEYLVGDPYQLLNELLRNAEDLEGELDNSYRYICLFDMSTPPPPVQAAHKYAIEKNTGKNLVLQVGKPTKKIEKIHTIRFKNDTSSEENPTLVTTEQISDWETLHLWFIKNRIPRNMNFEDERHVENSAKYIKDKSPILHKLKDKNVQNTLQNLLNEAIGDQRCHKDLMNYDKIKERYIWFESENDNPQNQYHAYHLAKPQTHEVDENAINNIPQRVKHFVDLLKKQ